MDKNKCDICGNLCTYGDGKTWARCFNHLYKEPNIRVDDPCGEKYCQALQGQICVCIKKE